MEKPTSVDIGNLFRKFDGDPGSYQEIKQDYAAEKAQHNWPLVEAMRKERMAAPKPKVVEPPSSASGARPLVASLSGANSVGSREQMPAGRRAEDMSPRSSQPQPSSGSARSVFGNLEKPTAPRPQAHARELDLRSEKSSVRDVFARLENPERNSVQNAPQNNLRSMLGFLKKT